MSAAAARGPFAASELDAEAVDEQNRTRSKLLHSHLLTGFRRISSERRGAI